MHTDDLHIQVDSGAVPRLNLLLRVELAAIETYRRAVPVFEGTDFRPHLQVSAENHARRADRLRREIELLGGTPIDSEAPWTFFRELDEDEEAAALEALVRGEDFGLNQYQDIAQELDGDIAVLVTSHLLPEQERVCELLSRLRRRHH